MGCWDKVDKAVWQAGDLPRTEKALNHIRAGGCCIRS